MRRAERTRRLHPAFFLLIFYCGQVNYFMYIYENVQSHESKCTKPKRISSCLVLF